MEEEFDSDQLSLDEISQGWHYCYVWKGLLIGPGNPRMDSCNCKVNKKVHEEIRKTFENDKRQKR